MILFILLLISSSNSLDNVQRINPFSIFLDVFGFILVLVGCFGRIWSSFYIEGFKTRKLITAGPYSLMRNPLYFFSLLILIGYLCAIKSIIIALFFIFIFIFLYIPTILNEERVLLAAHDDKYNNYYKKTPRFFPSFKNYTKANDANELIINIKKIDRVLIEILGFIFFYGLIRFLDFLHYNKFVNTYFILF